MMNNMNGMMDSGGMNGMMRTSQMMQQRLRGVEAYGNPVLDAEDFDSRSVPLMSPSEVFNQEVVGGTSTNMSMEQMPMEDMESMGGMAGNPETSSFAQENSLGNSSYLNGMGNVSDQEINGQYRQSQNEDIKRQMMMALLEKAKSRKSATDKFQSQAGLM